MTSFQRILSLLGLVAAGATGHAIVVLEETAGHLTTAVPVSVVTASDLSKPVGDILRTLLTSTPPPMKSQDLAELADHPPFDGLPDTRAVENMFNDTTRAVIRSISVVGRESRTAEAALTYALNNHRIYLAFGGVGGGDYEVRDDGSARYGTESLKLFRIPQPVPGQSQIHLYDPEGFRLAHNLANAGLTMVTPGYEGVPPQSPDEQARCALSNLIRSLAVHSSGVQRLRGTIDVLDSINQRLVLPADSVGFPAGIGRMLLNDNTLNDAAKRQKARDLQAAIYGDLLPREQWALDSLNFQKQTLDLTLANRLPSLNGYNEPFKKAGYFISSTYKPGTERPFTSYVGGYASINTGPTTPAISLDNRVWRITGKSDGTRETETFTLPELGGISAGGFDGRRLFVGGPLAGTSKFGMYGFVDTDGDGRIEPETKREVFRSDRFLGGGHLTWNPANGMGMMLDRSTRDLYRFQGSGADGFPTGIGPAGTLGNDRTDTWRLGFSLDGKWALGFGRYGDTLTRHDQHTESYFDTDLKKYVPLRTGYSFDESRVSAAAAGPITASDRPLRFSGSPDTTYGAYVQKSGTWTQWTSATTDPYGNGFFHAQAAKEPLKVGDVIRYSQPDGGESSPEYKVTPDYPLPHLSIPSIGRRDDFRLSYSYEPESTVDLRGGTSLNQLQRLDSMTTTPFGTGSFSDCLPDPPPPFYAWRLAAALIVPRLQMDYFLVPPGVRRMIYPSWNDTVPPGALYRMDPFPGFAASLMLNVLMNAQTAAILATAGTFANTVIAHRLYQNSVFLAAQQTVVIPDLKRLWNPPVISDFAGNWYVPVRCLVIGGKHYPMFQFRLAFPDRCPDAHWHADRVFAVDGDTTGIPDPDHENCGFGAYESIHQEDFPVPFQVWLLFRRLTFPPQLLGTAASPAVIQEGARQ